MNLTPLRTFLAGGEQNKYIMLGKIKAYVRKGYHVIDGSIVRTFDLANFECAARYRGKGLFRALVPQLKAELATNAHCAAIKGIYVENVLNDRLAKSLPSMGFQLVAGTEPPCFWMPLV